MALSLYVFTLALVASVHAHAGFWARGMYCLGVRPYYPFGDSFLVTPQAVEHFTFTDSRWLECRVSKAQMTRTAMLSSNPCSNYLSTNGGVSSFRFGSLVGSSISADIRYEFPQCTIPTMCVTALPFFFWRGDPDYFPLVQCDQFPPPAGEFLQLWVSFLPIPLQFKSTHYTLYPHRHLLAWPAECLGLPVAVLPARSRQTVVAQLSRSVANSSATGPTESKPQFSPLIKVASPSP